jgi:predicted small metal-binding protein
MAKQLKDQPTSYLMHAQQVIGMTSKEMHDFFGHVEEQHKEGNVSTEYYDKLKTNVENRILKNNEIMDQIESEVTERIHRDFPGATTSSIMKILVAKYREDNARTMKAKELAESIEAPKEKKVLKLKTSEKSE